MMSTVMSASSSDRTKTDPSCTINHVKVFVELGDGSSTTESINNGQTGSNIYNVGDNCRARFLFNFTSSHTAGGGRINTNINPK